MKKIILFTLTVLIFAGCQKEISDYINNPGNPGGGTDSTAVNALKGTWNFDTLHAAYQASSNVSIDTFYTLTVSYVNYTSFGTNGKLVIDDSMFTFTGYTYSISTTISSKIYQDNVFVNSSSYPYSFYVPPSNSTAKYQLIGTDSVYFPEGGFASIDSNSATKPYGLKFKINGNSLTFTQPVNLDTTFNDGGLTHHDTSIGTGNLYFHKN